MKHIIAIAALAVSFSALSAEVSFYTKIENEECILAKGKITRKVTFADKSMGYSVTKSFEGFGYEAAAKKAAELSTGRVNSYGWISNVTIDGVTSTLHADDSKEAAQLMAFVGGACH